MPAGAADGTRLRPEAEATRQSGTRLTSVISPTGTSFRTPADLRAQWQQIQFRFVDDPHGSVTEAADAIAQVTARLEAAIAERQRGLRGRVGRRRGGATPRRCARRCGCTVRSWTSSSARSLADAGRAE